MKNKICIITGATSGMGLATATALAGMGATIGFVCRNRVKGEAAILAIEGKTENNNIQLFVADLSSQSDVRRLAAEIKAKYPVIDVLVNNAGAINPNRTTTIDGFETTFAVNHLAYFLLTNLLLDNLKAANKARIVSTASEASRMGNIYFDDLQFEKKYNSWKSYGQSKLANIIFTYVLAKQLSGTNVTVNCLHPGGVRTGFAGDMKGFFGFIWKTFSPLLRSAEKGAETIIWLASSPEIEGISGKYFKDKKEIKSMAVSYNHDVQKKLWEVSEELTKLK